MAATIAPVVATPATPAVLTPPAPKPKEKGPACKLSTIINGQFVMVQMIGKGGYGVVYEVIRRDSPNVRFACKAELALAHNNLKTEWDLMTLLKDNKSKHNIIGVELGSERNYNYIIMHLVGPSLADLRKNIPNKSFTLYTTTVCGIQCFDSLVEIQRLGYIHRDVKPSNFAIGVLGSDEEKLVYVLDFGLCRNMFNKSKELRKPRMKAPFRGTIPYCSLNIHQRMEPGRHDDFWSLLYMMIEFHLSDLPWENMTKENTKKEKESKIDSLLGKCPLEFQMIRCYLTSLCYSREPDYAKIRGVLCQIMIKNKFTPDMPLDWQNGGPYENIFKPLAAVVKHKKSKKKVDLSELLDLPKPGTAPLYTMRDFPTPGEQEQPRDESVSKSDDTIIEKEGPPPAPKPIPKPTILPAPVLKNSNENHHKAGTTISVKPTTPAQRSTGEHNSLKPLAPTGPGARSPTHHLSLKPLTAVPQPPTTIKQSVRRVPVHRHKSDNDSVKPGAVSKHNPTTMTAKVQHPTPPFNGSVAAPAMMIPPTPRK
ncbi:Protein CBG03054 [Caenorhabditis briggsae]|uniref:Protein CBG03054 n=1 Tax=Caenorhabditis briggsae TaxID=6238 RepID=A8WSW5_CAEBR|nr:Protein CBG03054 [Caenorhabditis briggsae]CAP23574.1 Protein CBG03054 [Caenorhabditis briggsae]